MVTILGIESSCDDTSAAVFRDNEVLSNVVASQKVHEKYGGVIPELASRMHQQNIIPVVDTALKEAGISKNDVDAIAFTQGPGLLGSLLVGSSFAKGLSASLNIPLIGVNHLHGHILSHFIQEPGNFHPTPQMPFLCLLVSGGHTQIIIVRNFSEFEIIGQTIDDAAGEAFDKCAKIMNLPYPGGPVIDKLAKEGNPHAFKFSEPAAPDLNYSFSGLKTSFLYFVRNKQKENPDFVEQNKADLCASLQRTIISVLMKKLKKASILTGLKEIAVAGGVSANSGLADTLMSEGKKYGWNVYIPPRKFTTDNAAMIAVTGYYKFMNGQFSGIDVAPKAKMR